MQITSDIRAAASGGQAAAMSAAQSPPPELPGVTHKYVDVDGVRYHYAEAGQGEPLVLLHGFPENWYMWRDLIPELAKHYRVIAPDTLGSGWTDAPAAGYSKANMADGIARFMTAVGAPRARVMGHDMGGVIGFQLALRHPEQVEKYLALDIFTPWFDKTLVPDLWRFSYQPVLATMGSKLLRQPAVIKTMLRAASPHAKWAADDFATFAEPWKDPAHAAAGQSMYREWVQHELGSAFRRNTSDERLHTPTLLVLGDRDPVVRPRAIGNYAAHADDMSVEVVPGAGHFLPEESPAYVAARALRFFRS
jgi:pimeloyl-ACP methyl ester carboxylesterase